MSRHPYSQHEDPYYRGPDDPWGPYGPPPAKRLSGLGLSSLIIGGVVLLIQFAAIALAAVLDDPTLSESEQEPMYMAIGLVFCGGMLLALLGLGLGIGALFQPNRGKVLAILGIVLNGMTVLCVVGLLIIGVLAGGMDM